MDSSLKTIKLEIKTEYILLFILFLFLSVLMYLSKGSISADSYLHFQITRYALKYPYLLLDPWGKPFFTLLFSPMALFGYDIAKLGNVFIGVLSSYCAFLTAQKLNHKKSIVTIFLVLFSPIYFIVMNSVLTEILFGFFLILIAYLSISGKLNFAALLFSFLPFVRTEGFILLPFFALFLLVKRRWTSLLLLSSGFIIYGFIGLLFYYHDFFWVFTKNPYPFKSDIYGHSDFLYFFKSYNMIWGYLQTILLLIGFLVLIYKLFYSSAKESLKSELVFVFVPAFIFFIFHVLAWWKGIFASVGELRIISCIIPLTAVIANRGVDFFLSFFQGKRNIQKFLIFIFCAILIYTPFKMFKMPLQRNENQKLVYQASLFVNETYPVNKVYYVDPLVSVVTGRDPYEGELIQQWFPNPEHPHEGLSDGDLVIWDAHFCPNEGHTPLKNFLDNNQFVVLKYLKPDVSFKVLGGYDYEVYVFQKKLRTKEIFSSDTIYYNGFEVKLNNIDSLNYISSIKNAGNYAFQLDTTHIYSPGLDIPFDKLKNMNANKLNASVMVYLSAPEKEKHASLVISFDRNEKPYNYNSTYPSDINTQPRKWNELKLSATIPNDIKETDRIKVYVWFLGKNPIYVDDLKVQLEILNLQKEN